MRSTDLIRKNLTHYWRTNLAVVLGVAVAVAVLAGALVVGDSVRGSLRELFVSRLGNADIIVTGSSFFREQLADDLRASEQFAPIFADACPLIVTQATIAHEKSGRRASGVHPRRR
jgi:hypothetical protein